MEETFHRVQENESLWSIANKYNMTTLELAKLNNMPTDENLAPGQDIKVLSHLYEVQEGDTLPRVASKFGLTPQRIAGLNGLGENIHIELKPKQFLKIG